MSLIDKINETSDKIVTSIGLSPKFFQILTLIMGLILIGLAIGICIYISNNLELIKSDPCSLCMEKTVEKGVEAVWGYGK